MEHSGLEGHVRGVRAVEAAICYFRKRAAQARAKVPRDRVSVTLAEGFVC
jgi:hypothetical protein